MDKRDFPFSVPIPRLQPLRSSVLRYVVRIEDQGEYGSCVSNSATSAAESTRKYHKFPPVHYSRFFLYRGIREIYFASGEISSLNEDCGAYNRDAIKYLAKYGSCVEEMHPYTPKFFNKAPSAEAKANAANNQILRYEKLMTWDHVKTCISSARVPFIFGFDVWTNFFDIGSNGIMPSPKGMIEGGHSVMATGYNERTGYLEVVNSWSPDWAKGGVFYMPKEFFLSNSTDDWWRITKGEGI